MARHATVEWQLMRSSSLGVDLQRTGMSIAEIDATLRQEAGYARHPSERRVQIKSIMRSLRGSPSRMAA